MKGPPITLDELDAVVKNLKRGAPGSDTIPADFYTNMGLGFKVYILEVINELKLQTWIPLHSVGEYTHKNYLQKQRYSLVKC